MTNDLTTARAFAANSLKPQDDMTYKWISRLADEVEQLRARVEELEPFLAVTPCTNPTEHEAVTELRARDEAAEALVRALMEDERHQDGCGGHSFTATEREALDALARAHETGEVR